MNAHTTSSAKNYCIGLDLLRFENICHFELIKQFLKVFSSDKTPPVYGVEAGLDSFLSMGIQLDSAVYLYESIKHMNVIVPQECKEIMSTSEFKTLEIVRNNVHTYFKKGNFALKANQIIDKNLNEYKLKEHDIFFALRNDISLAFQIIDNTRQLVGCDYFIQHCLFESDNKQWIGEDYRNFAAYLSSHIKAFAETVDETAYRLDPLSIKSNISPIELFDYKSADLFAGSQLSDTTAFRFMLMIFQISYGIFFVEEVLSHESYKDDDLWACFLSKLLAIKYDESIDNLTSLLQYATTEDKRKILSELGDFDISNLSARGFARDLRNTIHYQELQFDLKLQSGTTTRDHIVAIYLSNCGVQSIKEFREKARIMFEEMKKLQTIIRKIMGVDKTYTC